MKQATRDGKVIEQPAGQDKLLSFLYGTQLGRILLKPLTAPWISEITGKFLSCGASRVLIAPFIRKNQIDMSQFEQEDYHDYNAFFTRKIRAESRPVDMEQSHFISPCDSKLTVLPITAHCSFTLKHTRYTLESLLRDPQLADDYGGGYAMIFRLTVDDYHRYCYVADGTKSENIKIPGVFHTVNPIANDVYPIYKENSREYSILHTERFGDIVMMEVGALLVGKIVNPHGAQAVYRGQEKGYFQFGGSTVVLLVKKDMVQIDEDILNNSQDGIETVVRFGEKIGIAK